MQQRLDDGNRTSPQQTNLPASVVDWNKQETGSRVNLQNKKTRRAAGFSSHANRRLDGLHHNLRRHKNQQFTLAIGLAGTTEQDTNPGDITQNRNLSHVFLDRLLIDTT